MNLKWSASSGGDGGIGMTWDELYAFVRPIARRLIRSSLVADWRGQEDDLIEDLMQETVRKVFERRRRAELGEMASIYSLKYMVMTIVEHCWIDMMRRDARLVRPVELQQVTTKASGVNRLASFAEAATENAYRSILFKQLVPEIMRFPHKQRQALLIDLANHMSFGRQPTALQQAFLDQGVELRQYRQLLPRDSKERGRHASLLSHAYRRIRGLAAIRRYALVT